MINTTMAYGAQEVAAAIREAANLSAPVTTANDDSSHAGLRDSGMAENGPTLA